MVLFCINLDGGFVESSDFVAWLIPIKVCGAIGCEVTFLPFKAFISYINLRLFWSFHFGTSFEKMGWSYYFYAACETVQKGTVLCAKRVLVTGKTFC